MVWRSKLATPNSICGWKSMKATTQLSGVSRPFSVRFVRGIRLLLLGQVVAAWSTRRLLIANQGEQIGVDGLGLRGRHPMRKALVGLQGAVLQQLGRWRCRRPRPRHDRAAC